MSQTTDDLMNLMAEQPRDFVTEQHDALEYAQWELERAQREVARAFMEAYSNKSEQYAAMIDAVNAQMQAGNIHEAVTILQHFFKEARND